MGQHAWSAGSHKSKSVADAGARVESSFAEIGSAYEQADHIAQLPLANERHQAIAQLRESIASSPRVLSQRLQLEHSFSYPLAAAGGPYARSESIPSRVSSAFAGPVQRLSPGQDTPEKTASGKFIVEDGGSPGPGQAERSVFLAYLRTRVEQVAREVLARIGMNEEDCPYIPYWFGYYAGRTAAQVEAAIGRYAPEATNEADWRACAEDVALKVREAFEKNIGSGSLEGIPKEMPHDLHDRQHQTAQAKAAVSESDTVQACGRSQPPEKIGGLSAESISNWGLKPDSEKEVTVHTTTSGGKIKKEKKLAPGYIAPEGTRLYHATYPEAVESIRSTGLDPNYGGKSGGSDYDHWARNCKGYVYLTPAGAEAAAKLLQKFWEGQGDPKDPPRNKTNLPSVAVLRITVPEGGLALEADPDLGGVSLRTRTLVQSAWIGDAVQFEAGRNNPEYQQAMLVDEREEGERRKFYNELIKGKKKTRSPGEEEI